MLESSKLDWQKNTDGLLPAIIQDHLTCKVLMLGYMNEEALAKTQETGKVYFYSRTKKRLWMKGEESGNTLEVESITTDCDSDTLLVSVKPNGPTCHTGNTTCFKNSELPLQVIGTLIQTIKDRSLLSESDASYTKKLLTEGKKTYGAKILEESVEVVRAIESEGKTRSIEEACDLMYHLLVLLEGEEISISDIAKELNKRKK